MKPVSFRSMAILAVFSLALIQGNAQYPVSIKQITGATQGNLTEKDAVSGIREALIRGAKESVGIVSKTDGYFGNPQIKIPFPKEAKDIETKLRSIGLGSQVDEVVMSLNRAAEDAAKSAEPVFVSAITGMTVNDAIGIVKGPNNAATQYLQKTTTPVLKEKFTPIVKTSLDRVNATKLWSDLIKQYNQIPFVKKQNPDLTAYVTDMAIQGLFTMVAQEEAKIRKDPAATASDLLKKVFGK